MVEVGVEWGGIGVCGGGSGGKDCVVALFDALGDVVD